MGLPLRRFSGSLTERPGKHRHFLEQEQVRFRKSSVVYSRMIIILILCRPCQFRLLSLHIPNLY